MPRKNLIRTKEFPYHITMRSNNREWFRLPMPEVWSFCLDALSVANYKHPVNIQAFVLMSNHYHALIWTPNANIDKFMYEFNKNLSLFLRGRLQRINRVFGGRYKWSLIKDESYYLQALKYIYQNPLKVHLTDKCEDYPFGTLHYYIRNKDLRLKLYEPIIGEKIDFLNYINTFEDDLTNTKIGLALKRPVFKVPCNKTLAAHC